MNITIGDKVQDKRRRRWTVYGMGAGVVRLKSHGEVKEISKAQLKVSYWKVNEYGEVIR